MSFGQQLLKVTLGILGLIVAAQISFELNVSELNIPITGQTLGVILVAFFLPNRLGMIAVALYLILGGLGMPIFAEGSFGWEKFAGGSGGFLIGFLLAAVFIYFIKLRVDSNLFTQNIIFNIGGTFVIVSSGVIWLTYLYGFDKALEYGFYPFWIGALVKVVLGIIIIEGTSRLSGKRKKNQNLSN